MKVLEKVEGIKVRSSDKVCSGDNAGLVVDPAGITFDDLTSDAVTIRVKIRNQGERRSSPAQIRLESAPFGAFVPWRPLAIVSVPALEPGESREVNVAASRPHPAPLGDFNRIPPMSVLTALSASPDERRLQRVLGVSALVDFIRRRASSRPANKTTVGSGPMLPHDLWELFGREQPHWAGNINVFVGDRAVERHVAQALRIYSGRTNLAMFIVGGAGKRDAYAFDVVGLPEDWTAALHDMSGAKTLIVRASDKPVQKGQWVQAGGMMLLMLVVRPPIICEEGKVQVHVTRKSCRKTAVVEFDLDPTAQGAGCYAA